MPPAKHAMLGASNAHRWLACTPSAALERTTPEEMTSEAAEEGTVAHAIAEKHLQDLLEGRRPATPADIKAHRLYRPVMEEHVAVYTDAVMEALTEARQTSPDAILLLEQRVDYSAYAPGGFGTADCLLIAGGLLQVFDFKYGKGVPVFAEGNPQLRLYALGALEEYGLLYDIDRVRYTIIQPRLDSITSEEMSVEDLMAWGKDYVRPRAALAADGKGEPCPGDHCTFCRYRYRCRALAEYNLSLDLKRYDEFSEQREAWEMTPADIAEVLDRVDGLTRWARGVKDYALEQAVNHGVDYPGYKVVEGRSNRKIADEGEAIKRLSDEGFDPASVTRLCGMTDLEEVVGKAQLTEVLGELIVKPQGKPTLVKASDRRPAIQSTQSAKDVFGVIEGD